MTDAILKNAHKEWIPRFKVSVILGRKLNIKDIKIYFSHSAVSHGITLNRVVNSTLHCMNKTELQNTNWTSSLICFNKRYSLSFVFITYDEQTAGDSSAL